MPVAPVFDDAIADDPSDAEFTGKYERPGRIGGWLVDRFFAAVRRLLAPHLHAGVQILEVGCGAGHSTRRIAGWADGATLVASDIGASLVRSARLRNPGVGVLRQSVYSLAHPDRCFDAVVMLEVLEHLEQPQQALAELCRVCRGHVLLSVPREPLWRALNMARGKYWSAFGNTPGHIQHWSTPGLVAEVSNHFRVVAQATPVPWTLLLLAPRR